MDRGQFDSLARLVSSKQSRRAAFGTLLGATLLRHDPTAVLAKGKGRGKIRSQAKAKAKSKPCYPGTRCTPGKGRNTSGCDFTSSTALFAGDFRGANLSNSNFTGAQLAEGGFSRRQPERRLLRQSQSTRRQTRGIDQPGWGHFLPHVDAGWVDRGPRL